MARVKVNPQALPAKTVGNGRGNDVLTLPEAAHYLRLTEEEVLQMVREENLPARRVGTEWRFFRTALQVWLSLPLSRSLPGGIWAAAGAWKDDPHLEELLKDIYRDRGRPMGNLAQ